MRIALCTDAGYLPWAATTIASALRAHPGAALHVDLLHEGSILPEDEAKLRAMVTELGSSIDVHAPDVRPLEVLPSMGRLGRAAWLRLLLPQLLPEVDRLLYLDADTLVVDSLSPLWATDLGGAPFAAVANVVEPALHPHVAALGIDDPSDVFNSGVMLMDLAALRRGRFLERMVEHVSTSREPMVWADQSALNAVFSGEWLRLHPRWNAQNSFWGWQAWAEAVFGRAALREATEHPAIIHFEGPSLCKPWHYLCEHPWVAEYQRTLALTPWAGSPLEDRTLATRAIRCLPAKRRLPAYRRLSGWRRRRRRL